MKKEVFIKKLYESIKKEIINGNLQDLFLENDENII